MEEVLKLIGKYNKSIEADLKYFFEKKFMITVRVKSNWKTLTTDNLYSILKDLNEEEMKKVLDSLFQKIPGRGKIFYEGNYYFPEDLDFSKIDLTNRKIFEVKLEELEEGKINSNKRKEIDPLEFRFSNLSLKKYKLDKKGKIKIYYK